MNVLGTSERSWRKARKRAVSPIIATILLVAITVVLAAVLYVLISGLTHGPGNASLGTAFGWGIASPEKGAAGNPGCTTVGHFCYVISIASASGVTTADLQFAVRSNTGGAGPAFTTVSLVDITGAVVATWTAPGAAQVTGTTTTVATTETVVLDMGTTNLAALGDSFAAIGVGSFTSSVPVALP